MTFVEIPVIPIGYYRWTFRTTLTPESFPTTNGWVSSGPMVPDANPCVLRALNLPEPGPRG